MSDVTKKRCSRCAAEFECGAREATCWCKDLPPIGPFSDEDCLCPKCLWAEAAARVGDCLDCRHAQRLGTKGGSTIFLCRRAETDTRLVKYPTLPTRSCPGRES